jgi:tetratricopeptide (TPR) repeat protein
LLAKIDFLKPSNLNKLMDINPNRNCSFSSVINTARNNTVVSNTNNLSQESSSNNANFQSHAVAQEKLNRIPLSEFANAPSQYYCPVTLEIMKEPYSNELGHTYEKEILGILIKEGRADPLTQQPFQQMFPNIGIKQLIQTWKEQNALIIQPGYPYMAERNSTTAQRFLSIAKEFSDEGNFVEAEENYKKALKYTDQPEAYKQYAELIARTNNKEKADRAFYELDQLYKQNNQIIEVKTNYEQSCQQSEACRLNENLLVSQGVVFTAKESSFNECVATLRGHEGYVRSIIQLTDGRLASASDDSTIKFWSTAGEMCFNSLSNQTSSVYSLIQLRTGALVTGSADTTIKLWDLNSTMCIATLSGHTGGIWSLIQLSDGRMVSSSTDSKIKVWSTTNNTCMATLLGHTNHVLAVVELNDKRLASASNDSTIKLWDLVNNTCVSTLSGHMSCVNSIKQLTDGRLASASSDTTIKLWNLANGTCTKTLSGHTSGIWSLLELIDGRLASGANDGTIKLWNLGNDACTVTLSGHAEAVYSIIQLNDNRLASTSGDKSIKLWLI